MGGPPPGMGGMAGGGKGGKGNPLLEYILKHRQRSQDRGLSRPPRSCSRVNWRKLKPKPMDKADKNDHLALQTVPVRMAIIAAAFPYKKQVEEFRTRLGVKTNEEVLTEGSMERDKDGNPQFAFRFLGVLVERRELDADGAPVEGKDGQWRQLDLNEDYKPYVVARRPVLQAGRPDDVGHLLPRPGDAALPEIGDKGDAGEGEGMGGEGPPAPGGSKGGPPAPMGEGRAASAGSKGGPPMGARAARRRWAARTTRPRRKRRPPRASTRRSRRASRSSRRLSKR